jgi:hypothetical protein
MLAVHAILKRLDFQTYRLFASYSLPGTAPITPFWLEYSVGAA